MEKEKVYTKFKKDSRKHNGQFQKFKEIGHFKGTHSGKHRVCSCCKNNLEITRNPNALYCNKCAEYIKKLRWRFATANKRMRNELDGWNKLGCLGRIRQQLKSGLRAKLEARNLRQQLKYYKNKDIKKD